MRRLLLALSAFALASCATINAAGGPPPPSGSQYLVFLEPQTVPTVCRGQETWASLPNAEARIRRLTHGRVTTAVYRQDTSGGLTYLGASANVGRGTYRIVIDWLKYCDEDAEYNGERIGTFLVGVALRTSITVTTTKNNVNLSGLIPLALQASRDVTNGRLNAAYHGFSDARIDLFLPPSSAGLTPESVEQAQQAVGALRAVLTTNSMDVSPQILEFYGDVSRYEQAHALAATIARRDTATILAQR